MSTKEYMTVEEAAALWKVRPERITYTCDQGGMAGAAKLSGEWIIPTGGERPVILRLPRAVEPESEAQGNRTRMQQAFMDAFQGDAVPIDVVERKIGNKTYIVTSCASKTATHTLSEALLSMMLRDLNISAAG